MTVRKTLMFAAECRMPRHSTKEERIARVDDVFAGLNLTNAQNTPVGDELIRGVSSGEKKRTMVATEMIAWPKMLFLGEPTSCVHTCPWSRKELAHPAAVSTTMVLASPWSSCSSTSRPSCRSS
ncbi:hypothetical protein DFJ74DRAFT_694128 [Hyaloraphidium curvatum]|nr:hypothetical protein DFJ74DRAFT_694128 [Hyaloraphidium curvatum]